MVAIILMIRTKYACNLDKKGGYICLQSQLQIGLFMFSMSEIVLESGSRENKFSIIAIIFGHIWSVSDLSIFSPLCNYDCKHIWSPLLS